MGALVCLAASLLTGVALATDGVVVATPLVVPDQGNNRVLIYFSPIIGNDQPANIVIGQPDFTSSAAGTSSTTLNAPAAYALDSHGNLYVSDSGNCRVLKFAAPLTTGEAASLVIGEPDFNTACGGATSASSLSKTGAVAIDVHGNLWAADSGNNRVLRFLAPLKNGKAASIVVGQPDYVTNTCVAPPTAYSLCNPVGVTFDLDGILWVADSQNSRVLGYRAPGKKMLADVEYGQPAATAFTSNSPDNGGVSASSLFGPNGISFDTSNRLWVADTENNRVLVFPRQFHHNGLPASVVLGQPDFTSSSLNQGGTAPSASTLFFPYGIVALGSNMWVGDTNNNRTLQFTLPVSNDASASLVLGQPDVVSNASNQGGSPSDQTQDAPFQAGPSLIALAVLAMMAGGWHLRRRLQRAS
jgi:hypothetical protein